MEESRSNEGLVTMGYITAIVMPVVGVVIGIVLAAKETSKHGARIVGLSVAVMLAGGALAIVLISNHDSAVQQQRAAQQQQHREAVSEQIQEIRQLACDDGVATACN